MKVLLKEYNSDIYVPINGNNIQLIGNIYPIYVTKDPDTENKVISCINYYVPKLLNKLINYLKSDLKIKYNITNTFLINSSVITNVQFLNKNNITDNIIRSNLEIIVSTVIYNEVKKKSYGYYYLFDQVNFVDNKFNLKESNCMVKSVFDHLSSKMYLPPNTYTYVNDTIQFRINDKGYIVHLNELHTDDYLEVV